MTNDQQSAGRTARRFRLGRASAVRVAAVASALCLAAGMGLSMSSQASAAAKQPPPFPPGVGGHDFLPVCISFGGILRLALPIPTCNGPVVNLELAGPPGPPPPPPGPLGINTDVHLGTADVGAIGDTTLTSDASCHSGEVATGGGFTVTGLPAATTYDVTENAPLTGAGVSGNGDEPDGWTATVDQIAPALAAAGMTLQAYVVCTHEAPPFPFHGAHHAAGHAAARH